MKRYLVSPTVMAAAMLLVGVAAQARNGRVTPRDRIVFVSERDGNSEIYSVKPDGTDLQRLTNHPGSDREPVWSPDGRRIAFTSSRDGGGGEIYVMNADGTNVVRRTFSAGNSQSPSWSPDGTKIAYASLSNGSQDIWVVHPDAGAPTLLFAAPGFEAHPAWSPDGSQLAIVSDLEAYDIFYNVFLIDADGSNLQQLTGTIVQEGYFRPSWSPNGQRIAVINSERVDFDTYIYKLGIMKASGSQVYSLVESAGLAKSSWSPDGRKIAYTATGAGGTRDIAWVKVDDAATIDESYWGTIITDGWDPDWRR